MNIESCVELCVQQLWQVSALIVAVGIVAPFIGRRRPHFAYLLWLLVFAKCVTPPLLSSPTSVFSWSQRNTETVSETISPDFATFAPTAEAQWQERRTEPSAVAAAAPANSPKTVTPIPWPTIIFGCWILGVVAFANYLIFHWTRFLRIARTNTPPSEEIARIYTTTAESLGLSNPPRLLLVDKPFGPAAIGCLRPSIVVPVRLIDEANESDLQSIFTHELTHIRRGDVWVSWLQVLASCVWWFHPLVWYSNRQIVRWREAACDEEVIAQLSISPRTYANALLRVMESRVRPFPAMQVGMAVGESTQTRLVRLMKQTNHCRRTPTWCWAAAIVLGLAVLPGGAFSVAQQADFTLAPEDDNANEDETPEITGSIQLFANDGSEPEDAPVLRETLATQIRTHNKPMNEIAEIKVAHIKDGKQLSLQTATSTKGVFTTPKKEYVFDRSNPGQQRVVVMGKTKDGAVAWKEWSVTGYQQIDLHEGGTPWAFFLPSNQVLEDVKRGPLTANVEFAKEHTMIAGTVRDHEDMPVANAEVAITSFSSGDPQNESVPDQTGTLGVVTRVHRTTLPASMRLTTKTDANGNWKLGKVAKSLNVQIQVNAAENIAVTANAVSGTQPIAISIPSTQKTSIQIVDAISGQPAKEVKVTASLALGENARAMVAGETDTQGRVRLALPLGKLAFSMRQAEMTTATNYPTMSQATVDASTNSLTLKMDSATQIKFHVVNEETGKPFPLLSVQATRDSKLDHSIDRSAVKQGITLVTCKSGKAKFEVPGIGYRGYEVLNPMEQTLELPPGRSISHTFRVRKMKEYRIPEDDDNTHLFSPEHQAAVKKLRALGAQVHTEGTPDKGNSSVTLTQFWKGNADDLSVVKDMQFLKSFMCLTYPVPEEFQAEKKLKAPTIGDDYLKPLGTAKDLFSIYVPTDSFTDKGLAQLAGCDKLQSLFLKNTTLRGKGLVALNDLPISTIDLAGPNLNFANVDLSSMPQLLRLHLNNKSNEPIIPPKVGNRLVHADIQPANTATLDRLSSYENLKYVILTGETANDELLKHALLKRIQFVAINTGSTVTDEGLANLFAEDSKLVTLTLMGKQFTDNALQHVAKLPNLRGLQLQNTSITKAGLDKLKAEKPNLNVSNGPNYHYRAD